MKYERFEQLPVWQAAMTLTERVYALTDARAFNRLRELRDQIRRAALSVSNNIAEGFERGTTAELLSFLYIARGSAGEVRSMLLFCERLPGLQAEMSDFKPERAGLRSQTPGRKSEIANVKAEIANLKSEISNLKSETANCKPETANRTSEAANLKSESSDFRSELAALRSLAESCSRQLRGWADQLQNSDIQGQRRLTDKSRHAWEAEQRAEAFMRKLQNIRNTAANQAGVSPPTAPPSR
ncbi:MAG TPA: four helix bundle protein [Phycisphaerae bacterium]|nr:four helix bundle protein [Phycisphaerae bacterium]HNU43904.1 four helix bundle protein [Phycisphaerae bacterium]